MADFTNLKDDIKSKIKSNGKQEITGAVLQQTMLEMIDETDRELTELSKPSEKGGLAYDALVDNDIVWTRGKNYGVNGAIDTNLDWEICTLRKGLSQIKTNVYTDYGGYICFFREDGTLIQSVSLKREEGEKVIDVPEDTYTIGVTNKWTSNPTPYVYGYALDNISEKIKTLETDVKTLKPITLKGELAYDALVDNDIVWTRGKNYNANGAIDTNLDWEICTLRKGLSQIKTNVYTDYGGYICFFREDGTLIQSVSLKREEGEKVIDVPEDTYTIGVTNKWTSNPNPYVYGYALDNISEKIKTLENKVEGLDSQIIYTAFGDSISSDEITSTSSHADGLAYPRTLARMLNANIDRYTTPGTGVQQLKVNVFKSRTDADLVTCAYGINNLYNLPLGDLDEVMSKDLAELASDETFIGMYRYSLESLRNRLTKPNALICCISPFTNYLYDNPDKSRYSQDLVDMRAAIKEFVRRKGGPNAGWFFIDGADILPWDALYFIDANNDIDYTHPNTMGEAIIAKNIFNRLPNIHLYLGRKDA